MGSMVGLILQSLIFMSIGVWHLCSLFSSYVKSPRDYSARAWYPVSCGSWLPSRLKHSELYMMLLFIPLAIFYELGISTHFQPLLVDGGAIPGSSILGFEHVTTLFMFWLFALLVLLIETTIALPLPTESSFLFASLAFTLEWMSINHETVENAGLEKQCKSLLAFIVAICTFSSGKCSILRSLCMNLLLPFQFCVCNYQCSSSSTNKKKISSFEALVQAVNESIRSFAWIFFLFSFVSAINDSQINKTIDCRTIFVVLKLWVQDLEQP